ncbi:hypothetical protein FE257_012391 [Aspergillus nanangensis]|uniref:Translation regulator (Cya5) n=1 Tax=Aspergillus nanangensis TaxID=2582783 RepID=A0AAD4GQ07_ASPNN|nr:hypothetical protein FE257_012391 [Aspergillus nanangensis]
MLERAAGCLENAGRRFFRDSNGAIRSPRPLYPTSVHTSAATAECSLRLVFLHNTSGRPSSQPLNCSSSAADADDDARAPILEFLYPPSTQEFASSCILHPAGRFTPRRKKRTIPSLTRPYTSQAADLRPVTGDRPFPNIPSGENDRTQAKDKLLTLLANGELGKYDEAWELYLTAGYPLDVKSTLLAYLSPSDHAFNHRLTKRLFEEIPILSRTPEDYLNMARSFLAAGEEREIIELCQTAISQGNGTLCWAFSLAHFVNFSNWEAAQEVLGMRPGDTDNDLRKSIAAHLDTSIAPKVLLSLSTFLLSQPFDASARKLARVLLDHVFSISNIIENTPTETLLLILREYHTLSILTPDNYYQLITNLISSNERATFVRSLLIYRNFRWQMDREVPPARLIGELLRRLTTFQIVTGMRYLLDECAHFYGKPSVDAYKHALIAFSRAGDVANVDEVFGKFLSDYGKPASRRLVTPLLYVHARVGNVQETTRQFNKITEEFGLKPNTVCWNMLLTAYANSDDIDGIFATFKRMLEEGVEPNPHTFGILMGLCANRGDIDTVRQILAFAKKRKVKIASPMLDTIVEAYCNNQRLDIAESVAETGLGMDVKGSRVRMWNLLLWNYAFRIDLESISRIRSRMDAAGVRPDDMTYAALMLSLVLIGQTDSARRILRTLHRSHQIYATEFHYAIILYGYVKDRNRDMVHIIFREIKERFARPGFSSNLLILKSQIQRDLQALKDGGRVRSDANARLKNAERFLSEAIADFDMTKLATKHPLPGTGKQPVGKAYPAMYYEYMITAYGRRGAFERAKQLFDQYVRTQKPSGPSESVYDIAPLRLLSALMLAYLKAEHHKEVEECWKMAFPRAKEIARPPLIDDWLSEQLPAADTIDPPRPSLPIMVDNQADILTGTDPLEAQQQEKPPILPSCRFMLSRPLSLYMRSLAYRNEPSKIHPVVAEVEKAGFVLTTYNWSTFVQMLASSDKASDQVQAFSIFEDKFMPNFPGWNNLRRGYGLKPAGVPSTIDIIEPPRRGKHPNVLGKEGRRYWSKIQPDFMQPTYVSMVYLASALLGFRERSIIDGGAELNSLYRMAPRTIDAVADLPYLREKFQGVLLRRRQEQGDKREDLDVDDPYVWTGGILGVGGQPRGLREERVPPEEHPDAQSSQSDDCASSQENSDGDDGDLSADNLPAPPDKTIDPQDEYDIEAESLLETRRNVPEADDELLDNEHRANSEIDDETDVSFEDVEAIEPTFATQPGEKDQPKGSPDEET